MTLSLTDAWLEDLDLEACVRLLRENSFGRIAVVEHDAPIVLPVNYRLVEASGVTWVAVRTRPGNVLDRAPAFVALEIDAIDPVRHEGWSVLVRGTLHRVDPDVADFRARFDSEPWLASERDSWLMIEPFAITGRLLHPAESDWAFCPRAYL
jgi:nitroimidazol reductase NimA-like FMN-containing flavoprotein (pyridoxamine 5'-phosphate oxidase superfamily)